MVTSAIAFLFGPAVLNNILMLATCIQLATLLSTVTPTESDAVCPVVSFAFMVCEPSKTPVVSQEHE